MSDIKKNKNKKTTYEKENNGCALCIERIELH